MKEADLFPRARKSFSFEADLKLYALIRLIAFFFSRMQILFLFNACVCLNLNKRTVDTFY